jgi:hypothetical protein
MAALWTFGGVSIYINSLQRRKEAIWAEIDIIDATATELHWYGAKSPHWRVAGTLWGASDIDTLEGFADASDSRTFAGPNGFSESFKLVSIESRRIPDKTDVTNECFGVDLEIIKVS